MHGWSSKASMVTQQIFGVRYLFIDLKSQVLNPIQDIGMNDMGMTMLAWIETEGKKKKKSQIVLFTWNEEKRHKEKEKKFESL